MDKLNKFQPIKQKQENLIRDEIHSLRDEIHSLIEKIDITQKEAADIIAETLDPGSEKNFAESFKSDLKRCTKVEKLNLYLSILKNSEKYKIVTKKLHPINGDPDIIGKDHQKFIHNVSKIIADKLNQQDE
ncbi:MAG: hypothetical protein Q4A81_04180 [Pasteurellaceae bacterium]|nr:hypothetical protein [Pasteurellaceae bacterium]